MTEPIRDIGQSIEVPSVRQTLARGIIHAQISQLPMVSWVGGYGSFWVEQRRPRDIDLVIFVQPSFSWGKAEEIFLVNPLEVVLKLPVDLYTINNTTVLSDEVFAWRTLFSAGIDLYGFRPGWL